MTTGLPYGATAFTAGPICLDDTTTVLAEYPTDHFWNGFLCPAMDPWSVEKVLTDLNDAYGDEVAEYGHRWDWEDGVLVVTSNQYALEEGDDYIPERYNPTADGLYSLGAYGWVWTADESEVATIEAAQCVGCWYRTDDRAGLEMWNGYGSAPCHCSSSADSLWFFFDGHVELVTADHPNEDVTDQLVEYRRRVAETDEPDACIQFVEWLTDCRVAAEKKEG